MEKAINKKRILIFVGITFALTYALEIAVISPLQASTQHNAQLIQTLLTYVAMLLPSVGVVLTRLLTKEGFANAYIKPVAFKKTRRYYVLAWFLPTALALVGIGLYFVFFPATFDVELTLFGATLSANGVNVAKEQLQMLMVAQLLQAAIIGPVSNFLLCFGEEWGWRGYLLPKLKEQMGMLPTLLVSGVLWGLWHVPLICMGHNYGTTYAGYPFVGILAMCVFCVFVGAFLSFVTLKTKSCIAAAIAHAAINATGTIGVYLTTDGGNPLLGPSVTGLIGGFGYLVMGILCMVWLVRASKPKASKTA